MHLKDSGRILATALQNVQNAFELQDAVVCSVQNGHLEHGDAADDIRRFQLGDPARNDASSSDEVDDDDQQVHHTTSHHIVHVVACNNIVCVVV